MTLLPPTFHFPTLPTHPSPSASSSTLSPLPPAGSNLVFTDTAQASADFCLYSVLGGGVREKREVILVDFHARGRAHYEAVCKKLGTPLPPKNSPLFHYISPTSLPASSSSPSDPNHPPLFASTTDLPTLVPTWNVLSALVAGEGGSQTKADGDGNGKAVMLVGFSELVWMGFEGGELGRFVRGLLSLCSQHNSSLITHLHASTLLSPSLTDILATSSGTDDAELDLLLRVLRIGRGVWWRVEELRSGRSGVVHGEISIQPLYPPPHPPVQYNKVSYSHPLQYRLDDTAVRVFPKGTGKGYL